MNAEEEHVCEACGDRYIVPSNSEDPGICRLCDQGQIGELRRKLTAARAEAKQTLITLGEVAIQRDKAKAACAEMRSVLEWLHMGSACGDAASAKAECPICNVLQKYQ